MSSSPKSTAESLLRGMASVLFAIASLPFWIGGQAFHEFAKTERILAEIEGIGLAVLFAALGAIANHFAETKEDGTPTSGVSLF